MSVVTFRARGPHVRIGLKGPKAAPWLLEQGIAAPEGPNTWSRQSRGGAAQETLIARLGASEFFLEEAAEGSSLRTLESSLAAAPAGVYPVLREDAAFLLSGDGSHDVLAQVCNIDFARVPDASRSVVMTMMIGVAVLVIPDQRRAERSYLIWCDPSFGEYLASTLGTVILENGGIFTGVSA